MTIGLFMQDARLAKALEGSIDTNLNKISILKRKLEEATDPLSIDQLLKQISALERQVQDIRLKLQDSRLAVGDALVIPLSVQ